MSQGCLLSAALKQLQLKMLSEVWILTKLTPLRSARHSSTTEQEVAVGLRKLITKNDMEKKSFLPLEMGLFLVVLIVMLALLLFVGWL